MSSRGPWWDETGADGHRSQRIDRETWAERLDQAGDRPPEWMRPVGRRPAETTAGRLRYAVLLCVLGVIPTAVIVWSLGGLR